MRAVCVLLIALSCLPATPEAETTAAVPIQVRDTCAHCHPPLALPEGHPAPQSYALEACRTCHFDDARGQATVDAGLLHAMHLGHVEDMGFDCTLCHVDTESDIPRLRMQLEQQLQGRGRASHE